MDVHSVLVPYCQHIPSGDILVVSNSNTDIDFDIIDWTTEESPVMTDVARNKTGYPNLWTRPRLNQVFSHQNNAYIVYVYKIPFCEIGFGYWHPHNPQHWVLSHVTYE